MLRSKLPDVGLTIFSVMTKLSNDYNAINLSQGFPDFDVHSDLLILVNKYMRSGHNQYAPMQGVLVLREMIADTVRQGKICMAMIGLLYALPRTQLTRRLTRENRFDCTVNRLDGASSKDVDQTSSGLNFVTKRPRSEILSDYMYVLRRVYSRKEYFDRCLKLGLALRRKSRHKTTWKAKRLALRAFLRLVMRLGLKRRTFYYFWRNFLVTLALRPSSIEEAANLMAMYIHFRKQTDHILELMAGHLDSVREHDHPAECPARREAAVSGILKT